MVIVPDVTAPDLFTLTKSKIVGTRKPKVLLTSFKGQSKI